MLGLQCVLLILSIIIFTGVRALTVGDLIRNAGYPYERHTVITKDNYILELERIPHRRNESTMSRTPILLVHGLMGASTDWILLGPKKALSFLLADNHYDVWIVNCRGTFFTEHKYLKPTGATRREFWNFSWHEIGIYDMPAVIDYILSKTQQEQLTYIGHSQGCTAFYVLLSEKPEYNRKIKAHFSYAPGVFVCHSDSLAFFGVLENQGVLTRMRELIGDFNAGPRIPVLSYLCQPMYPTSFLCKIVLNLIVNLTPNQLIPSMMPLVFKFLPAGGSTKQLVHYAQGVGKCQFKHYQSSPGVTAKAYNLKNVRVPIYSFSAEMDTLQTTVDTKLLGKTLPNGFEEFNLVLGMGHTDLVLGKDAKKLVYVKTLNMLNRIHKG